MRKRWIIWLSVLIVILAVGEGLGLLMVTQGAPVIGQTLRWICRVLAAGWIVYALIHWRHVKWVGRFGWIVILTLIAALIAGMCHGLGSTAGLIAIVGIYAMGMGFYVGMLAIRLAMLPGIPLMGVARTLVDEAMRMKLPLVFIVALMLIVPILPLSMDPTERLQYRIQSFLSWSMMSVFLLLSLMTIFLAVGTITREMDRKQIYLTLTKPVSRVQYLAGKWVGIVLLDLVLVVVAGLGIYAFTSLLDHQPARSGDDRMAVENQVLVARSTVKPLPTNRAGIQQLFMKELERARRDQPQIYGNPGTSANDLKPAARQTIEQRVIRQWYTVGPMDHQTYRFTNLGNVAGRSIQLRIKPDSAKQASYVWLQIRVNGRYYYLANLTNRMGVIKLAAGDYHVLPIASALINKQGVLNIQIANFQPPDQTAGEQAGTVSFNPADGIEVFYRVGGFEGNLARSLGVLWIRLAFLAMLGLAAGSFLGFPIASLLCVLIYITASSSSYLTTSIQYYSAFPHSTSAIDMIGVFFQSLGANLLAGNIGAAIKVIIAGISGGFLKLVPAFSTYSPTPLLADGRLVGWRMIGESLLWVGLVWTGGAAICGYLIFRSRELARVTV